MCLFINVLSCTPGPAVIVLQVQQSLYCPSHHINQSDHSTHPVLLHCMGHCHLSLLGTGRNGLPLRSVSRGAHVTWHRSHYTCHVSRMSHVTSQFTCHMSHVTCPTSHVTCHLQCQEWRLPHRKEMKQEGLFIAISCPLDCQCFRRSRLQTQTSGPIIVH